MFDLVHENKRFVQVILALIILPFVFWGVNSAHNSSGGEALATVNGEEIHQQEFDNALRQQQATMRERMGDKFDPSLFEKPEIKQSILENLITQHFLTKQADTAGLMISDQQLAQIIGGIGAFQKDGKFDKKVYESVLRSQKLTPVMFEARVQQQFGISQLTDAYTNNGYASTSATARLVRLSEQQRVISISQVATDSFLSQVKVDDAAVKAYYDKNPAEFKTPEQARVEYVELSAEALLSQVEVSDDELKEYYKHHQQEYGTQEKRKASHILITVSANASEADKLVAKAKAEQVLQKVKKSPEKFAQLAKEFSKDPGSASKGGDLGEFGRGMMVKPFDDAVFKLQPGEISDLVETDYGFHIIKLISISPAKVLPLADVRAEIELKLRLQKAEDKFAELAEQFSNVVYEQRDTLKAAAELVGSPVQQSAWLSKSQVSTSPWTEDALKAVFSNDVLKDKRNSAAIEVASNTFLSVRLLEYKPASERPLSEVSDVIRKKLLHQQAQEMAFKQGKANLEQLKRGENVKIVWKTGQTMSRQQLSRMGVDLMRHVFQADAKKLPAYIGEESASGNYTLVRVDEVKEAAEVNEEKRSRFVKELRKLSGDELLRGYLADAKKHAEISSKTFAADVSK